MRLSDILSNPSNNGDSFRELWEKTEAADDFGPIPPGDYTTHIVEAELTTSQIKSTPCYKLTFQIIEGDFIGRKLWHDCWLTPAALPQTKRDLAKLGLESLDQLEQPIPRFIRCNCKVAIRRDDDGNERNRIKSFIVTGFDKLEEDPFAPVAVESEASDPAPVLPAAEVVDIQAEGGDVVPF